MSCPIFQRSDRLAHWEYFRIMISIRYIQESLTFFSRNCASGESLDPMSSLTTPFTGSKYLPFAASKLLSQGKKFSLISQFFWTLTFKWLLFIRLFTMLLIFLVSFLTSSQWVPIIITGEWGAWRAIDSSQNRREFLAVTSSSLICFILKTAK